MTKELCFLWPSTWPSQSLESFHPFHFDILSPIPLLSRWLSICIKLANYTPCLAFGCAIGPPFHVTQCSSVSTIQLRFGYYHKENIFWWYCRTHRFNSAIAASTCWISLVTEPAKRNNLSIWLNWSTMKYNTIVLKDDVNVVINEEFLLHKVLFQTAECFQGTCLCCDVRPVHDFLKFMYTSTLF